MDLCAYGVLWDMDGVLVDSGMLHRRAWRTYLARVGQPVTDEIFERGFGRPNEQVLPEFFGRDLSPAELKRLSEEKEQCYRDLVGQEGIRAIPGVLDWMARFYHAGVQQALATSGCRANAELIVDLVGARRTLQAIVTADEVPHGKPHPDVFLRAADLLSISPAHCLVIEDSLHGFRAARAAGMRCLALATTLAAHEIDEVDLVLHDMRAFSWALWRGMYDGG